MTSATLVGVDSIVGQTVGDGVAGARHVRELDPVKRAQSSRTASACRRKPGFRIRYSPRICFTTSSESSRQTIRRIPSWVASNSPSFNPWYSAALFVAVPR